MRHAAQREQVAQAGRRLAAAGLVLGTAGNVSARASEEEFAVSPTGAALGDLRAEQVCIVDRAGMLVDGPLSATSELYLHMALYERRDAGAVVHTHSPMATALACVEGLEEVPVVHYGMVELGGAVRVAPYHTFGTPELAEGVLAALDGAGAALEGAGAALEGAGAALMANHGAVCFAEDLPAAVELSLLLEWACGVYWHAAAIGVPRTLGEAALAHVREAMVTRAYRMTVRS